MTQLTKFILFLCFPLFFIACSNDDDSGQQTVVFEGDWVGEFTGGDTGTWSATISTDGTVSGQAFSDNLQQPLSLEGSIDVAGDFRATVGTVQNGVTFEGTFREETSSGTWESNTSQVSGNWTGRRD